MAGLLQGGCLCGAVRYTARTASKLHYYCHCNDCRKYGGSAYHAAIVVQALFQPVFEIWTTSRVDWDAPRSNLSGFEEGIVGDLPHIE